MRDGRNALTRALRSDRSLQAMCGILLAEWIWIVVRAVHVGMTADEALSFAYLHGSPDLGNTANVQWLNSWLMAVVEDIGGIREFVLRFPNVLSFGVYGVAGISLCLRPRRAPARWLLFVLLFTDPFMLEFFGLERGYGLSVAFTTAAVAVLVWGQRLRRSVGPAGWCSAVAVFVTLAFYANFSALNLTLGASVGAVAELVVARRREAHWRRSSLASCIGVALLACGAWFPGLLKLQALDKAGQIYYGASSHFVENTIGSLIQTWGYIFDYPYTESLDSSLSGSLTTIRPWAAALGWVVVGLMAIAVLTAVLAGVRRRRWTPLGTITLVVIVSFGSAPIEHLLRGTLYPTDRAALVYVPAAAVMLALALDEIAPPSTRPGPAAAVVGLITALALGLGINLVRSANVDRTLTWPFDSSDPAAVAQLTVLHDSLAPGQHITLDVTFPRPFAWPYFQRRYGLSWLTVVNADPSAGAAQVYEVPAGDEDDLPPDARPWTVLAPDRTQLWLSDKIPRPH